MNGPSIHRSTVGCLAVACAIVIASRASAQTGGGGGGGTEYLAMGKTILRELLEINTTPTTGNTTPAAEKLAARFREAGFPDADVLVVGPFDKNKNLVVRYRGSGARKPVLLMAHLDVVEALRTDWSVEPFALTERGGYIYGRGTQDVKGGASTLVASMVRLKKEGFTPDRDIILALTSGEEGGSEYVGMQWLIEKRRDLIDAEYAINVDAGGGEIERGRPRLMDVQAAEKVYHSVSLTVINSGGHSSLPRRDNAIYSLARALTRVGGYEFPIKPSDIVRAYFKQSAETAPTAATAAAMRAIASRTATSAQYDLLTRVPLYNAQLRTTCVATQLVGGHAENALPQTAHAVVNCRILPGEDATLVEATLRRIIADTAVRLTPVDTAVPSPPSPLRPDVFAAIDSSVRAVWGKLPIVPFMETGATDGLYLRNAGIPVYGVTGIFIDVDDIRAHGRDERIPAKSFDDALMFAYELVKRLTRTEGAR